MGSYVLRNRTIKQFQGGKPDSRRANAPLKETLTCICVHTCAINLILLLFFQNASVKLGFRIDPLEKMKETVQEIHRLYMVRCRHIPLFPVLFPALIFPGIQPPPYSGCRDTQRHEWSELYII